MATMNQHRFAADNNARQPSYRFSRDLVVFSTHPKKGMT
jgi:hypothetical protein